MMTSRAAQEYNPKLPRSNLVPRGDRDPGNEVGPVMVRQSESSCENAFHPSVLFSPVLQEADSFWNVSNGQLGNGLLNVDEHLDKRINCLDISTVDHEGSKML